MVSIRDSISEDIKTAMKAKDKVRLDTLRLIKAEILKKETSSGASEVDEAGLIQLLQTMKKQRLDSIDQFTKGGRTDLAEKEKGELTIIESLLPQPLSDEEIATLVKACAAELGVSDMKGMGQLIKAVVAKAAGAAEGKRVSDAVRAFLG